MGRRFVPSFRFLSSDRLAPGCDTTGLGRLMPGPLDVIGRFISSFSATSASTPFWDMFCGAFPGCSLLTVACTAGVVCSLAMGRYPKFETAFRPYFEIIRPIPPIA